MLTSMSRIIGCFTVSVSTLFAIACSYFIIISEMVNMPYIVEL